MSGMRGFNPTKLMTRKVRVFNGHFHLPKSKPLRIGLGMMLIGLGLLGFLPILGFWMLPLGFLVLSVDLPAVRRWRRQLTVWWYPKWRQLTAWWHRKIGQKQNAGQG